MGCGDELGVVWLCVCLVGVWLFFPSLEGGGSGSGKRKRYGSPSLAILTVTGVVLGGKKIK